MKQHIFIGKSIKPLLIPCVLCLTLTAVGCGASSAKDSPMNLLDEGRQKTIESITKLSNYDTLNIYSMDVLYDYNLDNITPDKITDTDEIMEMIFEEAAPGMGIENKAPNFGGCSVFTLKNENGGYQFGRNYDFKYDTSAMIVRCNPKDGYASIAHSALNNLDANDALASDETKIACLVAPFTCLDGINEKGLGIAVLTLDSDPVAQDTGKPGLATTVLIRLVLDKAATTEEAIELLKGYDMFALNGRDYHFYITDTSGDSRIVEFDCDSEGREMVVTPTVAATNFYVMYKDQVLPNQKNGVYGHGKERYDAILGVLEKHNNVGGTEVAWEALKSAAQEPNEESVTSNTQWSIVYNLNELDYEFVLHRNWDDVYKIKLKGAVAIKQSRQPAFMSFFRCF